MPSRIRKNLQKFEWPTLLLLKVTKIFTETSETVNFLVKISEMKCFHFLAVADAVRTSLGPKGMDKMVRLFSNFLTKCTLLTSLYKFITFPLTLNLQMQSLFSFVYFWTPWCINIPLQFDFSYLSKLFLCDQNAKIHRATISLKPSIYLVFVIYVK